MLRGGLRPWSRKGPDHGVGVDLETVNFAVDFSVGKKVPNPLLRKIPCKIHPGLCSENPPRISTEAFS